MSSSSNNMKIYTSKNCINCIALKEILNKKNISFEEIDGTTTRTIAFLRARKFTMQLPIIESDGKFYTYDQFMEVLK